VWCEHHGTVDYTVVELQQYKLSELESGCFSQHRDQTMDCATGESGFDSGQTQVFFLSFTQSTLALASTQPVYSTDTKRNLRGVCRRGYESDNSPPSSSRG